MDFLLAKATEYARSPAGEKPSGCDTDFRPFPATWFNDERYHDDPDEWGAANGVGTGTYYPADDQPTPASELFFADEEAESSPMIEGKIVSAAELSPEPEPVHVSNATASIEKPALGQVNLEVEF